MANSNHSSNVKETAMPETLIQRKSLYEQKGHVFSDEVIRAAQNGRTDIALQLGLQLERLNRISTLCYGMAVVSRIVAGNAVVEDSFDSDPDGEPPLGPYVIGRLNSMMAEISEFIANDIERAAGALESQVLS